MKDFLIVGQGVAGSFLAWNLLQKNKDITIIDNNHDQSSSAISAGIINPVIGKRFSVDSDFDQYFLFAKKEYDRLEELFGRCFFESKPIVRLFKAQEEVDKWSRKENEIGAQYLTQTFASGKYAPVLDDSLGSIVVGPSGMCHTKALLTAFKDLFLKKDSLLSDRLSYEEIVIEKEGIRFRNEAYKKVIFCEGYQAQFNPWFDWLPFNSVKGEILRIEMERADLPDAIINKGKWCVPLGGDEWAAGASYIWDDLDCKPTENGKQDVLNDLSGWIKKDMKVLKHQAAVRPVLKDQRPVLGMHPQEEKVGIFNGLASKGFLIAPYFANMFANYLDSMAPILEDVSINRFNYTRTKLL